MRKWYLSHIIKCRVTFYLAELAAYKLIICVIFIFLHTLLLQQCVDVQALSEIPLLASVQSTVF